MSNSVGWDTLENASNPSTIDNWVASNGIALVVNRVDGLEVNEFDVGFRYAGMLLTDSPDTTQNPRCGFGTVSDTDLDDMFNGVIVTASNTPGYEFTNLVMGPGVGGQAGLQLKAGGSIAPDVLVNGGSASSNGWAVGVFPTPAAGHLTVVNVLGFNTPIPGPCP